MFAPAPRSKQHANKRPALIADRIDLLPLLQLRSKSYLKSLYSDRHVSIKEIARLADVSHSVVHEALKRFGIPCNGNGRKHPGDLAKHLHSVITEVMIDLARKIQEHRTLRPDLQGRPGRGLADCTGVSGAGQRPLRHHSFVRQLHSRSQGRLGAVRPGKPLDAPGQPEPD